MVDAGKRKGSRIEEQVRVNCISSRFKLVPPERGGEPSMIGGKIDAGVWTKLHFCQDNFNRTW